eukprot:UN02782
MHSKPRSLRTLPPYAIPNVAPTTYTNSITGSATGSSQVGIRYRISDVVLEQLQKTTTTTTTTNYNSLSSNDNWSLYNFGPSIPQPYITIEHPLQHITSTTSYFNQNVPHSASQRFHSSIKYRQAHPYTTRFHGGYNVSGGIHTPLLKRTG